MSVDAARPTTEGRPVTGVDDGLASAKSAPFGSRANNAGGATFFVSCARSFSVLAYVAYGRVLPARLAMPTSGSSLSTMVFTPAPRTLAMNGSIPPEKANTPPSGATIAASVDRTERTGPTTFASCDWYTARKRTTEPSTRSS